MRQVQNRDGMHNTLFYGDMIIICLLYPLTKLVPEGPVILTKKGLFLCFCHAPLTIFWCIGPFFTEQILRYSALIYSID